MSIRQQIANIPQLRETPGIGVLADLIERELDDLKTQFTLQEGARDSAIFEKLFPEPEGRPYPAYALGAFQPGSASGFLKMDDVFTAAPANDQTFFFSPVYEGNCYQVQVKFIGVAGYWWDAQAEGIAERRQCTGWTPGTLYLGLSVSGELSGFDGLQLLFQRIPKEIGPFLPLLQGRCHGVPLVIEKAHFSVENQLDTHPADREFLNLYHRRKHIAEACANDLLRLSTPPGEKLDTERTPNVPEELLNNLPEQERKNLLWLELALPEKITDDQLLALVIHTNVYPVWNVQKLRKEGKYQGVVPLTQEREHEDQPRNEFLGIERIWHHPERPYLPTALFPNTSETYELGILDPELPVTFDLGRQIQAIGHYLDGLRIADRRELARTGLMNWEGVDEQLLQDLVHAWEMLLRGTPNAEAAKIHYLKLSPRTPGKDMIYIDYLVTQTEAFLDTAFVWPNLLAMNSPDVNFTAATLVTPPQGARRAFTLQEREDWVKKTYSPGLNKGNDVY